MMIYMPAVLSKWDSLKTDAGDIAVKMQGPSIGFMPIYSTYEDCKAEFPDRDVIEMRAGE